MRVCDFDRLDTAHDLSRALVACREDLALRVGDFGGVALMHAYSDLTDALIHRVHEVAMEGIQAARVTVAAVGGYGRREMSPFSDIDVAFITSGEEDDSTDQVVKRAFRLLMDVVERAGLSVGYSYRSVSEVENLPLDTQTALLDARRVAGSTALFDAFEAALRRAIVPAAFVVGHTDARAVSSDTIFSVEPNLKEGQGGLRDFHTARWIARIALGADADGAWETLRARGILRDAEIEEMWAAVEFIATARNALHLLAGRALDTLNVDRRAQVAERLGFDDAERFASVYFRHAHRLRRVYMKVASACLEECLQIEPGIVARDGRLCVLDRGLPRRDPASIVRVFQHARSYHLTVSRESADMVSDAVQMCKLGPEAARSFLEVLSRPGAAATLRSMADTGVLDVVVPQFAELMYLVPTDAAHQFTVGEHCLRSVEQLEALLNDSDAQFVEVSSRIQDLEALFLATLVHDIGKLDSGREHAKSGAFRAAKIAGRLGMSEESRARVEFLVRHHLRMAEVARLGDLQQPKTIRNFVSTVRDQQLLDMLLLLTVADYRSVGSRHWSQVQIRFLLELHERAYAALRSPDAHAPDIDRHRTRVRRELSLANLPPDEVDEHCASMPASYLLNTPPEDLAAHIGYVRSVRNGSPVVDLKDDRGGQFTLLTVITIDRPGLLSSIAGVLHALNIDIHAARIFTRSSTDEIAIDMLYVDFEGRQLSQMKKWQLEGELLNVLTGSVSVDALLSRWRGSPLGEPEGVVVRALEDLSDHATVVEIRALDRPGLLYYLTRKISDLGWNIHSARVATWGHEVRDVFYVTDAFGNMLNPGELARLEAALADGSPA